MMLKIKTIFRFSGEKHGSSNFVFQSPGKNFSFSKKKVEKKFSRFSSDQQERGEKETGQAVKVICRNSKGHRPFIS